MLTKDSRSQKLLDKVYTHLEGIDVSELSWDELKDFLEVVQKGQFLEVAETLPGYGFTGPFLGSNITPTEPDATAE